jgi:hypothetical protein
MSNETLIKTVTVIRQIYFNSSMKTRRKYADFFTDRLKAACTEPSLLAAVNRLGESVDCSFGSLDSTTVSEFIRCAGGISSAGVFDWVRQYPAIITSLCLLKKDDLAETVATIDISESRRSGTAVKAPAAEIAINVKCLSPLAHGADTKSGNCTLFRRMHVLSTTGDTLSLPFYAGNAVRGQMRDLLADDFIRRLGMRPRRDNPPVSLWFFHALYAGGALEENSAAEKGLGKILGKNGAARAEGFYQVRNTLPPLSLFGAALGRRILNGRFQCHDLRPVCYEWGNGDVPVADLFEWTFLTRREDHEAHDDNSSMIANTEVMKAGVDLTGGFNIESNATEIERSALGHGLDLLAARGMLGAENRRGLGAVEISAENVPSPVTYLDFMEQSKADILAFLLEIGAINAEEA